MNNLNLENNNNHNLWISLTIYLPFGFIKSLDIKNLSFYFFDLIGPLTIIFFCQLSLTLIIPVLPFIIKDIGSSPSSYNLLQSTLWTTQTIISPIYGYLSDRFGKKNIIIISLIFSILGNSILMFSKNISIIFFARILSGLGYQITLFRAYFAINIPIETRTSSFGLIGAIQSFSLLTGPLIGGFLFYEYGSKTTIGVSVFFIIIAIFICLFWNEKKDSILLTKNYQNEISKVSSTNINLNSENINNSYENYSDYNEKTNNYFPTKYFQSKYYQKIYNCYQLITQYELLPLLFFNFFFRFSFSVYKSIFSFFCIKNLNFSSKEIGYSLSLIGLSGIIIQGYIINILIKYFNEQTIITIGTFFLSTGLLFLSISGENLVFILSILMISFGYSLNVPCMSTLFSKIEIDQGLLQGVAGSIDRIGQALGPLISGLLLYFVSFKSLLQLISLFLMLTYLLLFLYFNNDNKIFKSIKSWFGVNSINEYQPINIIENNENHI